MLYYLSDENKGAGQTLRMRRLICAFVIRIWHNGPIATFYCDVPTEKVIFKGEQMHVRICRLPAKNDPAPPPPQGILQT